MSDFTDDEDRQLVELADMFTYNDRQIDWDVLTRTMKRTNKTRETLRQRLKTLKKTHGPDLKHFRQLYFKKECSSKINYYQQQASRQTNVLMKTGYNQRGRLKAKLQSLKSTTKLNRHQVQVSRQVSAMKNQRGCARSQTEGKLQSNGTQKTPTKLKKSPTPNMSPCFQKGVPPMKTEPPASLVLLASVACTTSGGFDA